MVEQPRRFITVSPDQTNSPMPAARIAAVPEMPNVDRGKIKGLGLELSFSRPRGSMARISAIHFQRACRIL